MVTPGLVEGPFAGHVAVVTGASRGIGRAVAAGLAAAGATVICVARTLTPGSSYLPGSLSETVAAIVASGGAAVAVGADIGTPEGIEAVVAAVDAQSGCFDVLVHAAQSRHAASFGDHSWTTWRMAVSANIDGTFHLCQAALGRMHTGGSIVLLSSGMADHDRVLPPGYVGYAVAKAATERLATALAAEARPLGIAVNALRPGAVRTEIAEHELGLGHDWSRWLAPGDIVPLVLRLAAERPEGSTGRVIRSRDADGS